MVPLILGFVGGITGIVETLLDMSSRIGATPNYSVWGISAIVFSLIGIVGSLLARQKPKAAGIVMLIAAVGGFISASYSFVPPGVLYIISALISYFTDPEARPADE